MQRIKTSERTLIFPSHPPFLQDHPFPLSHLDTDPNLHLTFRYLRAYTSTTTTTSLDPFHVISSSLSHFYPLAMGGTLFFNSGPCEVAGPQGSFCVWKKGFCRTNRVLVGSLESTFAWRMSAWTTSRASCWTNLAWTSPFLRLLVPIFGGLIKSHSLWLKLTFKS